VSTPTWLDERCAEASARLADRPAHDRAEANKYTPYRALKQREQASFEWGAAGVELLDLSTAMIAHGDRISHTLGALATGAWADASLAGEHGLVVLDLSTSGEPIRLSLRGLEAGFSAPRLVILTQPNVHQTLEIELLDEGADHHLNLVIEVDLAQGSHVHVSVLQDQSMTGFATTTLAARIGQDATFEGVWLDCGAQLARHDVQIDLAESGATTKLSGLMLPRPGQHHDHHVHIRHSASNTHSDQLFKGLVAAKGRSIFSGCVEVCEGAQGCSADQLSRGLLMGDGAEFDARPQLLISYDAVEASHGSSCGAMDDDALFFLRSRGLSPNEARYLMAQAFAGEVHERSSASDFIERSNSALSGLLTSMHP
jgi:Fe-S cluster assembly scaffold protein SufB